MDKKKSLLNVTVSIFFKIVLLIASLLVRRYLIKYVGNEANGLDSLYTSVIGFLSVAELGIGSAITFCMYKPIVEGDNNKVSSLFYLFRKIYLIVGAIILVAGCVVMFFLPNLAKDYSFKTSTIYLTFALMLISVVLTYCFSAETSLINAYKNNYLTTCISSGGQVIQYILQIIVLVTTHSFIYYMMCRIVTVIIQWVATEFATRKSYKEIIKVKPKASKETKNEVLKQSKAMFMHKIGGVLVNTADSVIISAFIGVVILGKYSNYSTIVVALTGTIALFFTPLTSIIGQMCVNTDKQVIRNYFNFFHLFNFILGIVFLLGYYAIIDNLVTIVFGEGLELSKPVSFVITVNYFIQFMRNAGLLFRDATGTFYNDRWKPLFEGITNVVLSIAFVYLFEYLFGPDFAVVGVIVATIITNLTICHVVEPHVLYKYAFNASAKSYYLKNYLFIAVFIGALFLLNFSMIKNDNQWTELLANGFISVAYSFSISAIAIALDKNFRQHIKELFKKIKVKNSKKEINQNNSIAENNEENAEISESNENLNNN